MATTIPDSTRAAVLHGPRDLRIERLPLRPLGPDDVLVAVDAVGVCGSDMHYFASGRNGQNQLRQPTVLGHEASGVVTAVGEDVPLPVGTRVAVEPAVGCGRCQTCRADLVTAFRYAHAFPTAIALAASGRVDLAGILTGRFPLAATADPLRAPADDPRHLKVVVRSGS